jgi:hypothetical protein
LPPQRCERHGFEASLGSKHEGIPDRGNLLLFEVIIVELKIAVSLLLDYEL